MLKLRPDLTKELARAKMKIWRENQAELKEKYKLPFCSCAACKTW